MQPHSKLWQERVSLKHLNTFGVNVQARYYARIDTARDLIDLFTSPLSRTLPRMVLGGGSNVLFLNDFEGLVVHMNIGEINVVKEDRAQVWIQSGAGVLWHRLVQYCVERDYAGIENLSLIPGTVGAAPIQNIGAYGVELSDVFESLEALEIDSGVIRTFDGQACSFGYRDSLFKSIFFGQYIILGVTIRLQKQPVFKTAYGAIQSTLDAMKIRELSVRSISDAVIQIRQCTLPNPALLGNAGSFFKNPVIARSEFERLQAQYPDVPGYKQSSGRVKIPAAWLIEKCGWKGKKRGAVGVHSQHALVIINYGGGTGKAVHQLAQDVQRSVEDRFFISLEPEVRLVA